MTINSKKAVYAKDLKMQMTLLTDWMEKRPTSRSKS